MTDRPTDPPTDKPTDGETKIFMYISLPLNIVVLFVVSEPRCGSEKKRGQTMLI